MKKSELRQLIREELKKSLLKENTGLITFEQLKQAVFTLYKEYSGGDVNAEDSFFGDNIDIKNEIQSANNVSELVNILDGMGFNGNEAYDFIFDSILKN
jgi:hypothetical protein